MNEAVTSQPTAAAGIGEAVRRLRASQNPGAGAPPYSCWVNRRLGRLPAALAAVAGLNPNQVTLLGACCTFPALALVALSARSGGSASS